MKIITVTEINEAANCLKNGGLVAFPTETVYGLGANALNPIAVAKIFEAKQRPTFDPLIVHISDLNQLNDLFESPIEPLVFELARHFMPGPLTIVHRKSGIVPDLVTSGMENVAVRMPSHPIANKLIKLAGVPIAAPSANKFGQLSPTSYKHVAKQKMKIDYLLAGDDIDSLVGIESTVVLVENNLCTILRPGIITLEDIKKAMPAAKVEIAEHNHKINSPGLLDSHYSTLKPLYFLDKSIETFPPNSGIILHSKNDKTFPAQKIIYTSETGDLIEIAASLFTSLHQMEDDVTVNQIYIEKVKEKGIGISIMDRLKKACFQYQ
jgi:L-threonylcarbamoyladenylate synthase